MISIPGGMGRDEAEDEADICGNTAKMAGSAAAAAFGDDDDDDDDDDVC